ncbi:unnamed protein product [Clavelina lepadiformis]|uniref:SAND domain-containing protein n=2 Tax=Clavelina lepadiformis TaxID=159417 RepID=A0ABP0FUC2_CLALP
MDKSSPTTSNIVATAISTANLNLTPAPDSPQIQIGTVAADASPQQTHLPMIGSPAQHYKSPRVVKMPSTESMEISDHLPSTHTLIKQQSRDSDTQSQRSMDASQPTSTIGEEGVDKTVVLRTEGKDPHLVTVTPPASFSQTSVNGESRMQHVMCSERHEKSSLINAIPMNLQRLTKGDSLADMHPKPKEDTSYPITCGNNKADLVWKKFICPGINAKCVKCGDEWYTPKEFVNVAGKSTLKDWKRAIRINGVMLRKMIENGELNYYDHDNNCSNQCRSNKSSSFDTGDKPYSFESDTREPTRELSLDNGPIRSSSEDLSFVNKRSLPSTLYKSQESNAGSLHAANSLERSSSEDSGLSGSPHLDGMLMRDVAVTIDKVQDLSTFWNGIIRMDLFDDIVRDVITQITNLRSKTAHTCMISLEDVVTMTNLVNSLEMIPSIVHKMSLHKHNVEKQAEESNQTIQELEKKLAEQKKFEQDLKRKSQHLDNVMSLTPTEKRQKRNIMRIVRQKAVDSRIPPGTMSGTSSSPVSSAVRETMLGGGRHTQRGELWPSAIQVDGIFGAASNQMARMNVSPSAAQAMSIPSFAIFTHPNMPTHPEAFASSSLHQAFISSQAVHHSSREGTQSPKK